MGPGRHDGTVRRTAAQDAARSRFCGFGEDPTFTRDRRDGAAFALEYAAVTESYGFAKYAVGCATGATDTPLIARYEDDATPNPTLGPLGVALIPFDPSIAQDERAEAVTVRGGIERRIVAAGTSRGRFVVGFLWP